MIADTQKFFIDILRFIPTEAELYIQSPHEEVLSVLNGMNYTKDEVYNIVKLSRRNREILVYEVVYNDIEDYIQSMQIKLNNQLLFEGHDGLEYGTFSIMIKLPSEFLEEYKSKEMIFISDTW